MGNWADHQLGIYLDGLGGTRPGFPFTFEGLRRQAEEALEPGLYEYVVGGAGDEHTQQANRDAFDRWSITPRMLAGAAQRDLSTELFSRTLPAPIFMAPVGVLGVVSPDRHGDVAGARAAAATGVPFIGSTLMQDPLEEVASHLGDTPGLFQLYPPADRDVAASLVSRAEAAGYAGIVVTLDTWTLGYRPRDLARATFPQLRGECLANYTSDPVFAAHLPPDAGTEAVVGHWASQFGNPSLSWDDLPWLRGLTDLPMLLKGICHPDDVRRALDGGMDGIHCSNHGGRQAASGPALDFLPAVVEAAGDAPVLFDSGVRNGVDVVKALALGATAVGIGRPYVFGAALGGSAGIEHVLRAVLAEADLTMGLNGIASLAELRSVGITRTS